MIPDEVTALPLYPHLDEIAGTLATHNLLMLHAEPGAGKIDDALQLANNALGRFPEHPEIMFLKAQILWEGFGYGNTARRYFKRVMEIVHEKESLHRWAASYIDDIEASPVSKKEDQEL